MRREAGVLRREGDARKASGGEQPLFRFDGPLAAFARALKATWDYATPTGRIFVRTPTETIRQPRSINGRRAFGLEESRENLQVDSSDVSNVANGATVINNAIAPDRVTVDADTFTATALGVSQGFASQGAASIPDNTQCTGSLFVKRSGAWEAPFPQMSVRAKNGAYSNGDRFADGDGWQRGYLTYDSLVGGTANRQTCRQSATVADWVAELWGAQVEAAHYALSLIETIGVAVTRPPDDLLITDGWTILFAQPKFQFWFSPSWEGVERFAADGFAGLMARTGGEYIFIQTNALGHLRTRLRDAAANAATTAYIAMARDDIFRVEVTPGSGTIALFNETQSLSASAANGAIAMSPGDASIGDLTVAGVSVVNGLMTEPYAA